MPDFQPGADPNAAASKIVVVHGPRSWPLATRLAMDLMSEGFEAAPMSLEQFRGPDRDARLAAATGLVVMYDWWVEPQDFEVLHECLKTRPVVFVRNRTQKVAPELAPFGVVALFDTRTFSHYQPVDGWGGYVELTEHFGRPERPVDQRRRGFAFVSYVSADREPVYEQLIPALAACRTGYFDYRYTERLDEARLPQEIARVVRDSQVVVAYASHDWRSSRNVHIAMEVESARSHARPIVAVTPAADAAALDPSMIRCVFGSNRDENVRAMASALHRALAIGAGSV
jgi:hypothetical protein